MSEEEATLIPSKTKKETITNTDGTFVSKSTIDVEDLGKLKKLKELYDLGLLTQEEYTERKSQIVDDITGTRSGKVKKRPVGPQTIIHRPPPDFNTINAENAIKYTFNTVSGRWTETRIKVRVDSESFAKGALRRAFHMQFEGVTDPNESYVAKMSIDPDDDKEVYFQEAEMQMYAMEWAKKFNQASPPKKIDFVKVWILQLVDRPDQNLCSVERFIAGPYRKHNNNFGYVNEDERNTPQAFSHFTYEASNHNILVCDIQGVGDLYTDPQMHTINGIGFGKGNLGPRGFEKFIETHRCNAICRFLKLPSINAKVIDVGTIPSTPYMAYQRVNVLNVSLPENSNLHAQLNTSGQSNQQISELSRLKHGKQDEQTITCCCVIL